MIAGYLNTPFDLPKHCYALFCFAFARTGEDLVFYHKDIKL